MMRPLAQRSSTEETGLCMSDENLALIHTFPLISIRGDAHLA